MAPKQTRDKLSLFSTGTGGIEELAIHLTDDDVYFAFVREEKSYVIISYFPAGIPGVRRGQLSALVPVFRIQYVRYTPTSRPLFALLCFGGGPVIHKCPSTPPYLPLRLVVPRFCRLQRGPCASIIYFRLATAPCWTPLFRFFDRLRPSFRMSLKGSTNSSIRMNATCEGPGKAHCTIEP